MKASTLIKQQLEIYKVNFSVYSVGALSRGRDSFAGLRYLWHDRRGATSFITTVFRIRAVTALFIAVPNRNVDITLLVALLFRLFKLITGSFFFLFIRLARGRIW